MVRLMSPHEHGQAAVRHIEEAVGGALREAARGPERTLTRAEVGRRIGIPDTEKACQWITSWALYRLQADGKAKQLGPRRGWEWIGS